jgi:hypothetical protein
MSNIQSINVRGDPIIPVGLGFDDKIPRFPGKVITCPRRLYSGSPRSRGRHRANPEWVSD